MINIAWLEDLLAIKETGSFRKAAQKRNITQPGISRRIQALERWAAVELVNRAADPVELTEHGRSLAVIAKEVVFRLSEQRLAFVAERSSAARRLSIVAPGFLNLSFLPRWLRRVEDVVGRIDLTLLSNHLPQSCSALDQGEVDLLLCLLDDEGEIVRRLRPRFAQQAGFSKVIGHDKLILLSAADADGRPRYSVASGSPIELLNYAPDCALSWAVEHTLRRHPEIRIGGQRRSPRYDGLHAMTVAGLGAAWLLESAAAKEQGAGILARAADPSLDIDVSVVAARPIYPLPPLARRVWQLIAEEPASDTDRAPVSAAPGQGTRAAHPAG
jgi:DNA-binding transcriptional LysR family regulator